MRQYLQLKDLLGMSSIEVGKLLGMKQLLILFRKKNKIRERKKNEIQRYKKNGQRRKKEKN